MLPIKARRTEVIVDVVDLEVLQGVEVILSPFPRVAHSVVVTGVGGGEGVDRIVGGVGHVQVGTCRSGRKSRTGGRHDLVGRGVSPGGIKVVLLGTNELVLSFGQDAVWF